MFFIHLLADQTLLLYDACKMVQRLLFFFNFQGDT